MIAKPSSGLILLFDSYEEHSDLCKQMCLPGWLASQPVILLGRNFDSGHNLQTFETSFLIPAMLLGTTDLYYFISLSVALTLAEGQKVIRKKDLLVHFRAHFLNRSV